MKRILLACALAATLMGCVRDDTLVGRADLEVVEQGDLPPPGREDLILQQRSYVIGPLDRVTIDVYGVPDVSRTVQVDASGTVALPLVGEVLAAGRTPSELASEIADRLRNRYVRDPQVTVNADTVNQMITVDGQVKQPGLYPVTGRMTLQRAVATARGLTEYANTNYVVVFRQVNNQEMAALYDLRAIRQGIYSDPEVFANDLVLVGEARGLRMFETLLQGAAVLVAPIVTLVR